MLSSGEVPAAYRQAVEESLPRLRAEAAKMAKGGKRARSRGGIADVDLAELAVQLNARQTQRAWSSSIVAALESKYCPDTQASTKGGARKAGTLALLHQAPNALVRKRPAAASWNAARGKLRKS